MADIFISYAHEDQAFVRRMVPALESEGFSVWWDHTIPPGKSWDTFIAKGIAEARCCIVLWSPRSIESDWVKEEATLAKEAEKLLPAQIDGAQPPVGFRRIQSANLAGWNGDANHAQWQLLLREARELVGAQASVHREPPSNQPHVPEMKRSQTMVVGAIAAAATAALIAFALIQSAPPEPEMQAAGSEVVAPAEEAPAADPAHNEELERLQRERDAENERVRQETAVAEAAQVRVQRAAAEEPWRQIAGTWFPVSGDCADEPEPMTFIADGGAMRMTCRWCGAADIYVPISGSTIRNTDNPRILVDYEIRGGMLYLTNSGGGVCSFRRTR